MGEVENAADRHRVRAAHLPELRMRVGSELRATVQARQALTIFSEVLAAEKLADLRLIVTELVTNSVKYGPGEPIAISVAFDADDALRGEVADDGDGRVVMQRDGDPAEGGLGLQIVDALASSWGVHPGSSNVWFTLA